MGNTCTTAGTAVPPAEMVAAVARPQYIPAKAVKMPIEMLTMDEDCKHVAWSVLYCNAAIGFIPKGSDTFYMLPFQDEDLAIKMSIMYRLHHVEKHTGVDVVMIFKKIRIR
jgi:hypothetical protein